jgi:hypothetical protein
MRKMNGLRLITSQPDENGDYQVEIGAGISLIDLYATLGSNWRALVADGPLGFNGGTCPSVGFGGLVAGGGRGVVSNRHGWSANKITAAEVVVYNKTTGTFEIVIANYTHHQDRWQFRWWAKVFRAPRVVDFVFEGCLASNRSSSIGYMKACATIML